MKKILTAVAMALLLVGCAKQEDDHSGILEKLAELENRVTALEGSITSIQSAIGDGVFVQKVEPLADPETGKTVGLTVTYTSGKVVYFEISPKSGYTGPVLSVITSGSGQLVWAVDGVAIKDNNGKEVPVNKTPVFTIDSDGNLLVSIDGGDPVVIGKVQNEGATLVDGIFTDLAVEQDKVVLTLSDGTKVNIPFATAFKLNIEQKEYLLENNNTITIPYTVSGKTANTVVGVAGYDPYYFYITVTEKDIQIKPLQTNSEGVLLIYADSQVGLTSIVTVTLARAGAYVLDPAPEGVDADYVAEGEGGTLDMHVISNVAIDVNSEDDWITIVQTKSQIYTITAKVDENKTGKDRYGFVVIKKKGTNKTLQSIEILQTKASSGGGAKDLSKGGSANSYIVTAAGDYQFKAVKGNSSESVGSVASAVVLWETENTTTAPEVNTIIAKVGVKSGYITFSTPSTLKPGNALIAAKDGSGTVLWSWHIWIPANTVAVLDAEAFAGAKMLDRNLGALKATNTSGDVDPLSIGLNYQWGRKDPFPGAVEFAKSPKGAAVAGEAWTYHKELATTEYAVQHPTEYISVPEVDSGVWNSEDPQDLWAKDGKKTIYDPCPPGYRVPDYNSDLPMWKVSTEGWTFEDSRFHYGDFWFTVAGYIDCWGATYAYSNLRTHIWTNKWKEETKAYCMYIRGDKDSKYYDKSFHKAKAGSVRCVAE